MQIINETIQSQLSHRTIREFQDKPIPEEVFKQLMEVGRRTATSTGMQASSIIRVTDKDLKEEISKVCNQKYVATAPELLIFIVDLYRNKQIASESNSHEKSISNIERFFSGFTDAVLTAQNIVTAVESLDLGAVFLGSILNDASRIIDLLNLPELTFPVVGLGIGYPNQDPQLKPRMDMKLRVFENEYKIFDNYLEEVKEYDEEMQTYYDLRDANRRVDSFSKQVVSQTKNVIPKRSEMLNIIRKQGFDLNLK